MYTLHRTFNIFRNKYTDEDPEERLFVSTMMMSVEEKNTAVNKTMQMQKQIKKLSEKVYGLSDLMMGVMEN